MKADQVTDHLRNIGEWISDEDKILTYKWLSKTLSVHVNTAKQLLFTYLSEQRNKSHCNVSATYLLAGKLKDGNHCVTVVNQDDLKTAYDSFQEITSEHVYSVQKIASIKNFQSLYIVNKSALESQGFGGPIKCAQSVPRSSAPATSAGRENEEKPAQGAVRSRGKEKEKVEVNEEEGKSKDLDRGMESSKNSAPTSSGRDVSKEKKNSGNNKKTGSIVNFFGNAAASKKSKSKDGSENKGDAVEKPEKEWKSSCDEKKKKEKCSPSKKPIAGRKTEAEPPKQKKKKEGEGKKRKRIKVFSDSEESENESSNERSPSPMSVDEVQVQIQVEPELQENKIENHPEPTVENKRKKRKIVDRTIMSEDGYIETKKEVVYETDSDIESEEMPAEKPVQDAPKRTSPRKKGNSNAKQSANPKKQSSLYSFFKKN